MFEKSEHKISLPNGKNKKKNGDISVHFESASLLLLSDTSSNVLFGERNFGLLGSAYCLNYITGQVIHIFRTTSPLVNQCQEVLNDISAWHVVGLFWVPGHAGVRGNEIADGLVREGSALRLLGPEPAFVVSRCDIRRRLRYRLISQHQAIWRDLDNTPRQARELISGPCPGTRIKLLSFNRNQSRVVTGLLTGHNTLRSHLHLMGLLYSPLCRKRGVKEEASARILCECEAVTVLRCRYLGFFFLEPEDIKEFKPGSHMEL
jgi:hypothetical protein